MSRKSDQINTTLIKLEDDTDEFYSTAIPHLKSSSSMAYKGKIEVTSKGRRKIFDGVRWQILCRRPGLFNPSHRSSTPSLSLEDCRKQTNKKSLCITHYKEEYETDLSTQFDIEYPNPHRMIHDGSIRSMHTARRLIFQNSKWQPLCKYDQLFPNKQSQISNHRRVSSSIIPYEKNKRLKINGRNKNQSIGLVNWKYLSIQIIQ